MDDLFDFQGDFSFDDNDALTGSPTKNIIEKRAEQAPKSPADLNLDDFQFGDLLDDELAPASKVEEPQKKTQHLNTVQEKDPFASAGDIFDFGIEDKIENNLQPEQSSPPPKNIKPSENEDDISWGDFYQDIIPESNPQPSPSEVQEVERLKSIPPTVSSSEPSKSQNKPEIDPFMADFDDDFGTNEVHLSDPDVVTLPDMPLERRAVTPKPEQKKQESTEYLKREATPTVRTFTGTVTAAWLKNTKQDEKMVGRATGSQFIKMRPSSAHTYDDTSDEATLGAKQGNPFQASQKPVYYSPPKSELTAITGDTSFSAVDDSQANKASGLVVPAQLPAHNQTVIAMNKQTRLPPRSTSNSPVGSDNIRKLQDQMNTILGELRNLTVGPDMSQLASALRSELVKAIPQQPQQIQVQPSGLQPSDVQSIVSNVVEEVKSTLSNPVASSATAIHGIESNIRRLEESIVSKIQAKLSDDTTKGNRLFDLIQRLEFQLGGMQSEISSLSAKSQYYKQAHTTDPNVLALNAALNLAEERAKRAEERYNESIQKVSDLAANAKRAMEEAEKIKIETSTALSSANLREAKARDLEEELNRLMESLHARERNVIARESEIRKKEASLREQKIQLETEMLRLNTQKTELEELKAKVDASRQLSIMERNQLIKEQETLINQNLFANPAPVHPDDLHKAYSAAMTVPRQTYDTLPVPVTSLEPQKRSKSAAREDLERAVSNADKALKASQTLSNHQTSGSTKANGFLINTNAHSSLAAMEYDIQSTDPKREALRVARQFLQQRALARSMVDTNLSNSQLASGSMPLTRSLNLQNSVGPTQLMAAPIKPIKMPPYISSSGSEGYSSTARSLPSSRTSYVEAPVLPTVATMSTQNPSTISTQHHSVLYSSRPISRTSDNITAQVTAINRPFTPIDFDPSNYTPAEVIYKGSLATVTPVTEAPSSFARRAGTKQNSFDISSESAPLGPLTSETSKSVEAPVMVAVSQGPPRQPSAKTASNSTSTEVAVNYEPKQSALINTPDENPDIRGSASVVTAVQNPPSLSLSSPGVDIPNSQVPSSNRIPPELSTQGQIGAFMGSTAVQLQQPGLDPNVEPSMSASAPIPFPANRENPMLGVQSSKSDPSTSGSISVVTSYKKQVPGEQPPGNTEQVLSYLPPDQTEMYAQIPFPLGSQPGLLEALSESNQNHYSTSRFTGQNEFYDFSPQISTGDLGYSARNPFADIKYDLGLSNFNSNEHSTSPMFPF